MMGCSHDDMTVVAIMITTTEQAVAAEMLMVRVPFGERGRLSSPCRPTLSSALRRLRHRRSERHSPWLSSSPTLMAISALGASLPARSMSSVSLASLAASLSLCPPLMPRGTSICSSSLQDGHASLLDELQHCRAGSHSSRLASELFESYSSPQTALASVPSTDGESETVSERALLSGDRGSPRSSSKMTTKCVYAWQASSRRRPCGAPRPGSKSWGGHALSGLRGY